MALAPEDSHKSISENIIELGVKLMFLVEKILTANQFITRNIQKLN